MTYLKLITPTNIGEEKERFFASDTYNPQLQYNWDEQSLDAMKSKHPELSSLIDALVMQDMEQMTSAAHQYFDVTFREADIAHAESIVSTIPKIQNGNAEQLATQVRSHLQTLDIPYTVEIVDRHGFQCRPQHKKQRLLISKYANFQYLSIVGVALHEVVHIIRAVNGKANGITPQQGYLATEEGLACLLQDVYSGDGEGSLFQHALEYLGAYKSLNSSFREIYDFFREHGLNEDVAWQRGIRQKFGLQDTAQHGGLCKSGMYFYHQQVLSLLPQEELLKLFAGKIRADQIDEYATAPKKISNEQLSSFFLLKKIV